MSASNNFITRPVLSTVCSLLIVIVGLISIPILPIENLPDIAPPKVKVQATFLSTLVVSVVMKTFLGQADAKPPEDGPTPTSQPS